MADNIYLWIGSVLCLCAIIILTYTVTRIKHINNKNIIINKFIFLIISDTILTLITGILMLSLGSTEENLIKSTPLTKCTTRQLVMKLSAYLTPVLTGLLSLPAWAFQLYRCTDCTKNNDQRYSSTYLDKKTITMIIVQWVIPAISILSTFTTKPQITKVSQELKFFSMTEHSPMLMINMGENFCTDFQNVTDVREKRIMTDDIREMLQNRRNLTSMIVNKIYDIVKQHNDSKNNENNKNSTIQPIKHNDHNTYFELITDFLKQETSNVTNNKMQNNNAIDSIMITDILSNKNHKLTPNTRTKEDESEEDILTGQFTLTDINILKLMENYTRKNHENEMTNYTNTTDESNLCLKACLPPQNFLKNLSFLMLLLNVFVPLSLTAVFQAMTNKNIDMMSIKQQHDTDFHRKISKILRKNTLLGTITLSPTILETTTRILLSIDVPQCISSALLILAMVGTVLRNIHGLYLINKIQNTFTAVHPMIENQQVLEETSKANTTKPQKQEKVYIKDIETHPSHQVTSTSTE